MERTLIGETPKLVGKTVSLSGWVNIRRDHGKLIFIDLRDRTGIMQTVVIPDSKEAYETAKKLRSEFVVEIEGLVKARPASAVNQDSSTGGVELEAKKVNIISKPEGELAIDVSQESLDLKLETLLDNRTLALRNEKIKSIFKIYSELLSAYDEVMRKEGYVEIKTPKILSSATEGGANFFKIKYFDREACLAQSPQFYKQAGVSFFERVFEIAAILQASRSEFF